MRIYSSFEQSINETLRELKEMGVRVDTRSYQDKDIVGDEDYSTLELQNYTYCVNFPQLGEIRLFKNGELFRTPNIEWCEAEWEERLNGIMGYPVNPGQAWKKRSEVWEQFLIPGADVFSYTYSMRLHLTAHQVIEAAKWDSGSRQLFIPIFDRVDLMNLGGKNRVPCTIGYSLQIRNGKLNLHYIQRSCDFFTHFLNDIYLAVKLQRWAARELALDVGSFNHTIFSLHIFKKDTKGVF